MELWRPEDFELMGPAFFEFNRDGTGAFQLIAVQGSLDCRYGAREGKPFVEFSWAGDDDGSESSGRGFAELDGGVLKGRLFFHLGDDSSFVAERGVAADELDG